MTLPGREEIAEILSPHLGAGSSSPGVIADEILARLRPAWETQEGVLGVDADKYQALARDYDALRADYERACQTIAKMHAAAIGEVAGPRRGVVEDVAALRADLRACVEALRITLTYGLPPHDVSGSAEWERARAALARPGVRDALK